MLKISLFSLYFLLFVFTVKCELNVFALPDVVKHESNMDVKMEEEVISHAAYLIGKSGNRIVPTIGDELATHMHEQFNGTWIVFASQGNASSSWRKVKNASYIRFSFENIMLIVAKDVIKILFINLMYFLLKMIFSTLD